MIVSITGGGGFIGKPLVDKHIRQGDQIRLLTRQNLPDQKNTSYFAGDLSSFDNDFTDFVDGADILYHCAGEIRNESLMRQVHVCGTRQLVEASKGKVGRLVQLSSVGAYGNCRSGAVTEDSLESPSNTYEQTKTESDNLVRNSGIPYVILRPSNVFGSTMTNQSLFLLLQMLKKRFFFYIGNNVLVNYVHVDDVVEALLRCGSDDKALGNVYNLSQITEIEQMVRYFLLGLGINRNPPRLPEYIVRAVAKVFGNFDRFPLTSSRIDALTGQCIYSSNKIMRELGFEFGDTLENRFMEFASSSRV